MSEYRKQRFRYVKNKPLFMYLFLIIQTVTFLMMQVSPEGSESVGTIISFGGMVKQLIIEQHEYWRFVTPIFVHIGIMHYVLNSLVLFYLGEQIEKIYGHFRFLIIYLVSGIAGNVLSFSLKTANVSAGASTAIFGMFGAFIILRHFLKDNPAIRSMAMQYTILVAFMLITNFFDKQVDILGHIGGLIGGILIGVIVSVPKQPHVYNVIERTGAALLLIGYFIILLTIGFNYGNPFFSNY